MRQPHVLVSAFLSSLGLIPGCSAPTPATSPAPPIQTAIPQTGTSVRVGGDLSAAISGTDGDYRAGPCTIDTPLPAGYPAPTPPGAIDLKSYPHARRAEVSGTGTPDKGMNAAFWPLFNHIKSKKISMTSPVEMDYRGMAAGDKPVPSAWTMAFLYRNPDMNQVGQDGQVLVHDAQALTVVSIGLRGDYGMALVGRGMKDVQAWLDGHPEWEPAGDWRSLYYNGPALMYWNKWAEVQLPVRPSAR